MSLPYISSFYNLHPATSFYLNSYHLGTLVPLPLKAQRGSFLHVSLASLTSFLLACLLDLTRAHFFVPEIKCVSYPLEGASPMWGAYVSFLHASSARCMLSVWHPVMKYVYILLHIPEVGLPPCGGRMFSSCMLLWHVACFSP